ncbi:uncharacterized protein LOC122939410 [Bufo gargarizans]|uniref:uncharacterized protein LOC122939410 n=1 Tax=Bufo gargarizans TaxID=30331 RepID=UPI001CF37F0C|nr:uncharacterized protein LOC122939410 [Bufo gargarizans]
MESELKSANAMIKDLEYNLSHSHDAYQKAKNDLEDLYLRYSKIKQTDGSAHNIVNAEKDPPNTVGSPDPPCLTPQHPDMSSHAPKADPIQDNQKPESVGMITQEALTQLSRALQTVTTLLEASNMETPRSVSPHIPRDRHIRVRVKSPVQYVSHESGESACESDSDVGKRVSYSLPRRQVFAHKEDQGPRRPSYAEVVSRKKNYQYSEKDQSSSSIIKFLNTTVSKFSKKGSSQIANHLELYESTMDSLKLYSDADRIRFLPWAFDDKYRHYFTSFRERGIQDWPSVLHEVKLEFGPYRTITAAKRDIYKLTCRSNQSPREFLSILKNAYGLAYRSPNWESEEFKQLFYDAMPTQIKLSLARDLDIEAPLDWLVTAATTLYNISECHETGERRFKKSPEQNIAEAKVNPSLGFETQPRKYPQSTGPVQQTQQQQVRPKQTKPQNPNGSEGDNSGAGRSNYRPYYNPQGYRSYYNRDSQGYRRWNNRPRQQREDRQEPSSSPRSRSPTNNQGTSQNQNMRKPNRVDQLAEQVAQLNDIVRKLSQVSPGKQPEPFLGATPGPSSTS